MQVRFRTTLLRRCYEDVDRASRRWGPAVGRKYIQRITILLAAGKFTDLFEIKSLRLHPLKGDRQGQYAIALSGRWRLILTYDESEEAVSVEEVTTHYGD